MTRIAIVASFFLVSGVVARANEIRHQVERSSDLEKELAYRLSIEDKQDVWRSEGLDKAFPVKGPAPEYRVLFQSVAAGKLKDIFGLTLTLTGADGIVVQVPLAIRSKWHKENEIAIQFLIKKELIKQAVLTIRCGVPNLEESYAIRLGDYAPSGHNP